MSSVRVAGYELLERIGEGGMGEVWLARHERLRRLVAIKLIRPDTRSAASERETRLRFEREAQTTSRLRSPHTVALYDYGTTPGGQVYYAMELLEGVGLGALVAETGPLPAERVVYLLGQICDSLAEAHGLGLVHRDIKPANVMACVLGTKYDFVKVLDFGLVKTLTGSDTSASLTATGVITGSPAFLPPETTRGEAGPLSDIYALGCVAYWLLTGKLVFEGATAIDIILSHLNRAATRPSEHAPRPVPKPLDDLVLDCLQKEPRSRPRSITEVAQRLEACPLEQRWTPLRAQAFFEEHRDALCRANPAFARIRQMTLQGEPSPDEAPPATPPDEAQIRRSIERLQHHFTRSHIDVQELELRMLRVKRATNTEEVDAVFGDLPALASGESAAPGLHESAAPGLHDSATPTRVDPGYGRTSSRPPTASVDDATSQTSRRPHDAGDADAIAVRPAPGPLAVRRSRRSTEPIVSIMSSNRREIALCDGSLVAAIAVMGDTTVVVDGTQIAQGGSAEMRCVATMGQVTVYVRPGVDVEVAGVGVLGAFEHHGSARRGDRPVVRITGVAVMGLVKIVVQSI